MNPYDFLSKSLTRSSLVTSTVTGGAGWVQLLGNDPLRVGLQIIPQYPKFPSGVPWISGGAPTIVSTTGPADEPIYVLAFSYGFGVDSSGIITPDLSGNYTISKSGMYVVDYSIGIFNGVEVYAGDTRIAMSGGSFLSSIAVGPFNTPAAGLQYVPFSRKEQLYLPAGVYGPFTVQLFCASAPVAAVAIGDIAIYGVDLSDSNSSSGFAFPVQQGSPPDISAANITFAKDPFSNTWINWPQYAPLPTYGWWYWVPASGTYSWLLTELMLTDNPCPPSDVGFQPPSSQGPDMTAFQTSQSSSSLPASFSPPSISDLDLGIPFTKEA
jgi:hypothetical protein